MNRSRILVRLAVWFVLACVGLNAGGCFTASHHSGTDLSTLDSFKIEKGTTTEQDLEKQFGPPTTKVTRGDGATMETWSDSTGEAHMTPLAIFGVTPDSTAKGRTLTATIRDGVVVDYTTSDTTIHS
jgi:hypothetical protein